MRFAAVLPVLSGPVNGVYTRDFLALHSCLTRRPLGQTSLYQLNALYQKKIRSTPAELQASRSSLNPQSTCSVRAPAKLKTVAPDALMRSQRSLTSYHLYFGNFLALFWMITAISSAETPMLETFASAHSHDTQRAEPVPCKFDFPHIIL